MWEVESGKWKEEGPFNKKVKGGEIRRWPITTRIINPCLFKSDHLTTASTSIDCACESLNVYGKGRGRNYAFVGLLDIVFLTSNVNGKVKGVNQNQNQER